MNTLSDLFGPEFVSRLVRHVAGTAVDDTMPLEERTDLVAAVLLSNPERTKLEIAVLAKESGFHLCDENVDFIYDCICKTFLAGPTKEQLKRYGEH